LLSHPDYLSAQAAPNDSRPIHLLSDQEVLTALLGADQFTDLPIRYLRRGREILQLFGPGGYTPWERLHNLRNGLPPLIHAMGPKPWDFPQVPDFWASPRTYYESACLQLSPYTEVARRYGDDLAEPHHWMEVQTWSGHLCRALSGGQPSLVGMPHAAFDSVVRWCKWLLGVSRYRILPLNGMRETT
jgi:hypothetical protein